MLTFTGLTAARSRLALLAQGLQTVASGEVLRAAVDDVEALVNMTAKRKLAPHQASGAAIGAVKVESSGARVEMHGMPPANGKRWNGRSYLSLQRFWPFRRGMPGFVVQQASRILAAHVLRAIGSRFGDVGALAGAVVDEAEAAAAKKAARVSARKPRRRS